MIKINENFAKLPVNYLFVEIDNRVKKYSAAHPEAEIIRMGIGDVTRPLPKAVTDAMVKASREFENAATFHGYGPEAGYFFLRDAISRNDFGSRGVDIGPGTSATFSAGRTSSPSATRSTRSTWIPT